MPKIRVKGKRNHGKLNILCRKEIGIELIDHIIIGSEGKYCSCSLKEKGIL